jgi:hypothetical protein
MATLTASLAASQGVVRAVHAGVNSISGSYNSGSSVLSASGQSIVLLCKIPTGATVLEVIEYHSSGADTSPLNIGIRDGVTTSMSVSVLFSAVTQGAVNRAELQADGPGLFLSAGTSTERFKYLIASRDGGSLTTSLKVNFTVLYTMDP